MRPARDTNPVGADMRLCVRLSNSPYVNCMFVYVVHGPVESVTLSINGNAVRPRRSGLESAVEIELKARIQHKVIVSHSRDVNFVVVFSVHFTE